VYTPTTTTGPAADRCGGACAREKRGS
jgi:hypothetical protein